MRTTIFTFLLLTLTPLIHYGQNSLAVSGGYTGDGPAFLVNYNFALNQSSYVEVAAYASLNKSKQLEYSIPYSNFMGNVGYYIAVFRSPSKRLALYIGAGGTGGYEYINNGSQDLRTGALVDAESRFIFGGYAGTELDVVLSESVSLYGVANESYHVNSDIGNFAFYGGLGIKYYFY